MCMCTTTIFVETTGPSSGSDKSKPYSFTLHLEIRKLLYEDASIIRLPPLDPVLRCTIDWTAVWQLIKLDVSRRAGAQWR